MITNAITFDSASKEAVLDLFGLAIDAEGYVCEKANRAQKVFSPDGIEVPVKKFGGIKAGSIQILRDDLPSLIALYDRVNTADKNS